MLIVNVHKLVYVFIGEHLGLIDLVRALDEKKLLDSGDYIIISVDDQIWDTKSNMNSSAGM